MLVVPLNFLGLDIGSFWSCYLEMAGCGLQSIAFQFPRHNVIVLEKEEGINQVPTKNIHACVVKNPLSHAKARAPDTRFAAVPSPWKFNVVHPGPGNYVFKIEVEQVMPLEYIRIELYYSRSQSFEHLSFPIVSGEENFFMAAIVH